MRARLLFIDHDPAVLDAYRQALASMSTLWTIDCVQSKSEAVAAATQNPPDILVAALEADEEKDLDALSQISKAAPHAHAFIAINEERTARLQATLETNWRYLPRPCPADRLLFECQRCLALDSWLENPLIKEIVASRAEFQSLPPLYLKIVSLINSPHASTDQIAEAISTDLAFSSKVLETVNSSFYAFEDKVSDIAEAVSILGLDSIKNLALAIQLFNRAGQSAERHALVNELWHHSVSVAVVARRISLYETEDSKSAEEAYSAGLLHDIGKLVLLDAAPEAFAEARHLSRDDSIPLWQAETQTIGCNHAELGAYLLATWDLPEALSEAAALHHQPVNRCRSGFPAVAAVYVANTIVRQRGNANHPDAIPDQDFLVGIGKTDSWEDWQEIAVGNPPPSKTKPKLSLQSESATSPEQTSSNPRQKAEPDETTRAAHAALSATVQQTVEESEAGLRQAASRPKRNALLAFAGGIVCCLLAIYLINKLGSPTEETGSNGQHPDKAQSEKPKIASREDMLKEILELGNPSDDSQPIAQTQPEKETPVVHPFPKIKLSAIFLRSTGARARVNGGIHAEGDIIDGARIVLIDRTHIVVQHEGESRTFTLD